MSKALNAAVYVTYAKKIVERIYNAFKGCHWYSRSVEIMRIRDCADLRQLVFLTNCQR